MAKEKRYALEIFMDNEAGYRETANELTLKDLRIVIAILEEAKLRIIAEVSKNQQEFDLKNNTKQ